MDKATLQTIDRLEDVLKQSLNRYGQLASLLDRKRQALRDGKPEDMTRAGELEQSVLQSVADLEQRRVALVADLASKLRVDTPTPPKMRDLAEALPEPHRGRLLLTRTRLVQAMQEVQEKTSVVRRASESLVAHVNGLIRTLGVVSTGGAAYGQTGRVMNRPAPMRRLNLTA